MTVMDVAVILSLGFTVGMFDGLFWGTDNNGDTWHVVEGERWLTFGKLRASGGIDSYERMTHEDFNRLFR